MRSAPLFEESPASQIYRPSLAMSLEPAIGALGGFVVCSFISLSFIGVLLFPPYAVGKVLGVLALLFLFVPLSYLFAMGVLWYTCARLIISPEGIAYQTVGYRLFATWQQVGHLGYRNEQRMQRNARIRRIEGLELHSQASFAQARPWLPAFFPPFPQHTSFIPLSTIVPNWQDGTLGKDIRRYAPHIFS